MDAVRFIEERNRMCKAYCGCGKCPAHTNGSCKFSITIGCEADKQVEIVKEWAAAHPRKTRQSEFLEQWPKAKLDDAGALCVMPCTLIPSLCSSSHCGGHENCVVCRREFWGKVVE